MWHVVMPMPTAFASTKFYVSDEPRSCSYLKRQIWAVFQNFQLPLSRPRTQAANSLIHASKSFLWHDSIV